MRVRRRERDREESEKERAVTKVRGRKSRFSPEIWLCCFLLSFYSVFFKMIKFFIAQIIPSNFSQNFALPNFQIEFFRVDFENFSPSPLLSILTPSRSSMIRV